MKQQLEAISCPRIKYNYITASTSYEVCIVEQMDFRWFGHVQSLRLKAAFQQEAIDGNNLFQYVTITILQQ